MWVGSASAELLMEGLMPILLLMLCIGILSHWFNRPVAKGKRGELATKSALFINLPSTYTILHNITLPSRGRTTQIDHVIVSPYGVFCVETKHMKGWIYGSRDQRQWTQVIYKKKTRFQNPLRQNYRHTETLRALLTLPKNKVHSVVAFTGEAKLKTAMPPNVGSTRKCLNYIKAFKTVIYSEAEVKHMVESIRTGRLEPTRATNKLHVRNLRNRSRHMPSFPKDPVTEKRTPPALPNDPKKPSAPHVSPESHIPTCPKCGATMILRTAKKGQNIGKQFWGCSNFPKCRKTLQFTG
jgi:predicted RNA-binding Zn-ribbon protein involved in translation (DUF1610 family)